MLLTTMTPCSGHNFVTATLVQLQQAQTGDDLLQAYGNLAGALALCSKGGKDIESMTEPVFFGAIGISREAYE